MNLIEIFQSWVAQVPDILQPLIVAAAGAVPFIEGEGATSIGILGGIPPVIAGVSAAVGNFLCVAVLVLVTSRTRTAIVTSRRNRVRDREAAAGGALLVDAAPADGGTDRAATRRAKFQRAFERFGVPGVSLLGPLLLPTQFTATMLAGAGVGKARVLIWQAVAIVLWTTAFTLLISGVVSVVR